MPDSPIFLALIKYDSWRCPLVNVYFESDVNGWTLRQTMLIDMGASFSIVIAHSWKQVGEKWLEEFNEKESLDPSSQVKQFGIRTQWAQGIFGMMKLEQQGILGMDSLKHYR